MNTNSEVKISIDGENVYCKEWTIKNENDNWYLYITYPSGEKDGHLLKDCIIEPTIKRKEDILFNKDSETYTKVDSVTEVGEKYLIVTYSSSDKEYLFKKEDCELKKETGIKENYIFKYFGEIAKERLNKAVKEEDKIIPKSIVSQFDKIISSDELAMNAFLSGRTKLREEKMKMIYPFGVNETQLQAIKNAFTSQISIIEGPPGTGKTQTILNIIANIIINGKTCAIVSNNNSAVENVYQKLEKVELDFLIAKLGNTRNQEEFFKELSYRKPNVYSKEVPVDVITEQINKIEKSLETKNKLERLKNQIREINIEKRYLEIWHQEHPEIQINYITKYKLESHKVAKLFSYIKVIEDRRLTLMNKWDLLIHYGIFKSSFLNKIKDRESFIFSLQYTYYEKKLEESLKEKEKYEIELKNTNFDTLLKDIKDSSMNYLYSYVKYKMPDNIPEMKKEEYKKNFKKFVKFFPVIGSSTYALVSSLKNGFLLDYVIVDEASQQDLVPGVLCFGCAKNVIIVGDRKQLPHIPQNTKITAPNELYDCTKYSLLESVNQIFKDNIPHTILKEHYRCHPKIIQFCNKQFYNGELIPMTEDNGEDAMEMVVTALGNHMRNYRNQREIESVMASKDKYGYLETKQYEKNSTIGFIAPYNNQVNLAKQMLPEKFTEATIHKFQGRECDEIIFSTVLDKKRISQAQIDFVDNAALVNVAVSRAKNKFTLVTGKDVFKKNNKYIAALVRYIEYYGDAVVDSPVVSAFDLLYREHDKSLERLAKRLKSKDSKYKSEQIVFALLREILKTEEFNSYTFHSQVYLKQLVKDNIEIYTERERQFIKNLSSCDFVIYYNLGKTPRGVIEVDGGQHDKAMQIERDLLKNSILKKNNIQLLRLKTTDSNIRNKIVDFLNILE